MNARRSMAVAALLMVCGIVIGALASHALQNLLSATQLHALDTAVEYQLLNALGLFLIGLLAQASADAWLPRIAMVLAAGIVCFSGGIYVMLAGAPRLLGLITPLGGVLMILAWAMLAWRLLTAKTGASRAL
jgi:uncharacterized membrane protein YgdD (TMEM256/DUF423 family)